MPFLPTLQSGARSTSFVAYFNATASGTAHTKGAYTTMVASTPFEAEMIVLTVSNVAVAATATSMLLDLAIGPAASEVVVVSNLNVAAAGNWNATDTIGNRFMIPLRLPAGVRISYRIQALIVSDTAAASIDLYGGSSYPALSGFAACDTYGANTALSKGVVVTPGASGAEGTWTEVVASTGAQIDALFLSLGFNANTAINARNVVFDIGAGASGSEQVLIADIPLSHSNAETMNLDFTSWSWLDLNLPAGQRLAVRGACSGTTTSYDVCLHGLRR